MSVFINLKEKMKDLFVKENIYLLSLSIIIFFLDRISKAKIIKNFSDAPYYVNEYINLNLIWNIGIGFGFLSTNSNLIYNLITLLIGTVMLVLVYLFIVSEKIDKFIYAIIIGGALGNFYDRVVYKAVPDYIDVHYNNFHWFTFNVADIFITIGILIFFLRSFFIKY
tara:strand:- start:569 stop:1069 length:501 start_codon:yes stop_codon:yes gene_type:complete